ncbi:MAG: class I SAM-dependent methyltransferase [Phycisphaerales bacterium]|nr:MAG: class I SAM-dependent methyltransferase [Phycisphaerales bacterium]
MPQSLPNRQATASKRLAASVAQSVDCPTSLLPVLSDLLGGLDSLGSSPRSILNLLTHADLGEHRTAIDLACGKGVIACGVARKFRCRVIGVDAFEPFLADARARATRLGVQDTCEFRVGDVRRFRVRARVRLAMMIGLDGADSAAPRLRRLVEPGGWYLIDDAVARSPDLGLPTLAEARRVIERTGDEIVRESTMQASTIHRLDARIYGTIASNARVLARRHPRLRAQLREFLKRQRDANRVLANDLVPMTWLVRTPRRDARRR